MDIKVYMQLADQETSSMLDEIESKTVHKDEESDR